MARSKLLDKGRELLLVYPEVTVTNRRGEPMQVPSDTPVEVWVTATYDRPSDAELPGQVSSDMVKCFTRSAPVGSWVRIVFRGEEWDLAMPPTRTKGVTDATTHIEFRLRSRNRLVANG